MSRILRSILFFENKSYQKKTDGGDKKKKYFVKLSRYTKFEIKRIKDLPFRGSNILQFLVVLPIQNGKNRQKTI